MVLLASSVSAVTLPVPVLWYPMLLIVYPRPLLINRSIGSMKGKICAMDPVWREFITHSTILIDDLNGDFELVE
jgi:hypothetical protein